jgi:hypothetical protein
MKSSRGYLRQHYLLSTKEDGEPDELINNEICTVMWKHLHQYADAECSQRLG